VQANGAVRPGQGEVDARRARVLIATQTTGLNGQWRAALDANHASHGDSLANSRGANCAAPFQSRPLKRSGGGGANATAITPARLLGSGKVTALVAVAAGGSRDPARTVGSGRTKKRHKDTDNFRM
jgi:hypothetical protein